MRSFQSRFVLCAVVVALSCGFADACFAQAAAGPGGGAGAAGGGGSSGGGTGGNGGPPRATLDQPPAIGLFGRNAKSISKEAERAIAACDIHTLHCIADALDDYAAALRGIAPQLSPEMRDLPDIVARAATRVRAARTREQAIRAVKIAIAEVHKTIALLTADDPITLKAGTREGSLVAETLQVADSKLEEATGL